MEIIGTKKENIPSHKYRLSKCSLVLNFIIGDFLLVWGTQRALSAILFKLLLIWIDKTKVPYTEFASSVNLSLVVWTFLFVVEFKKFCNVNKEYINYNRGEIFYFVIEQKKLFVGRSKINTELKMFGSALVLNWKFS